MRNFMIAFCEPTHVGWVKVGVRMAPGEHLRPCIFLLMPWVQERDATSRKTASRREKDKDLYLHIYLLGWQGHFCGEEAEPEWQVLPLMTPGTISDHSGSSSCLDIFSYLSPSWGIYIIVIFLLVESLASMLITADWFVPAEDFFLPFLSFCLF